MKEPMNLANAAVILGCMYFLINGNFGFWAKAGIFIILLFALLTWEIWHMTNDHKELLKKQINEIEARIKNLNANTAFITTQSALTVRAIKS